MKICFCGLGSIGKRHLGNLARVAGECGIDLETHAWRRTPLALEARIVQLIDRQIVDQSKLDEDYDIAFITNPTSMHFDTIQAMAGRASHMFIEKPLFDSSEHDVEDLNLRQTGVYYVAGPLRYSPVIEKLREITREQRIYSVRVICSSYLPDWRPGADYRQVYSALQKLGGGVDIDLIHEWDYLIDLFGFPRTVYKISGKYSGLDIDSKDLAVYIAGYDNKAVELHLDYFGRTARREIELFTGDGTIVGDLINNTISLPDGRQIRYTEDGNEIYLREMRFFLGNVLKESNLNNIRHCSAVLNVALGKVGL